MPKQISNIAGKSLELSIPPNLYLIGAATALSFSTLGAAHSISFGFPTILDWTVGEAATACAGFGTISAVLLALYQFARQSLADRSRFSLNMAMEGVRRSHAVISADRPAKNVAWVMGARLLLRAQSIQQNITSPDDRAVWELFKEEWRIQFASLLASRAEYFFGLPEIANGGSDVDYSDARLMELMAKSTSTPTLSMTNRHGTSFRDSRLRERAIMVVFDFASFPDNFPESDPLQKVGAFTKKDRDTLDISDMWGLYAYLYATEKWTAINGKVHERPNQPDGE